MLNILMENQAEVTSLTIRYCLLQGDQATFEVLSQAFHSSQVTGLDVCIRKPLIATCSLDGSVRIWNYETWYVNYMLYGMMHVPYNCL
jgi:WD40 repeat protein